MSAGITGACKLDLSRQRAQHDQGAGGRERQALILSETVSELSRPCPQACYEHGQKLQWPLSNLIPEASALGFPSKG